MSDTPENPRAVPADQRSVGPNETMIINPTDLQQKVASSDARKQAPVIRGRPKLVGKTGPVNGETFRLDKDKTTVGRSSANDIVIDDGTISARHAQLVCESDTWRVINLISTNGTAVNGQTNIVSYLAPGDVIAFGKVEMSFEAETGAGSRAVDGRGRLTDAKESSGSKTPVIVLGVLLLIGAVVAGALLL